MNIRGFDEDSDECNAPTQTSKPIELPKPIIPNKVKFNANRPQFTKRLGGYRKPKRSIERSNSIRPKTDVPEVQLENLFNTDTESSDEELSYKERQQLRHNNLLAQKIFGIKK